MSKDTPRRWKEAKRKTWDEFRSTGLLWFVNMTLHLFGWVLVFHVDSDEKVITCYPARTLYRGFPSEINEAGYTKLTQYMAKMGPSLLCDLHADEVDAAHNAWEAEDEREAVVDARQKEANRQEIAGMFLRGNEKAQEKQVDTEPEVR